MTRSLVVPRAAVAFSALAAFCLGTVTCVAARADEKPGAAAKPAPPAAPAPAKAADAPKLPEVVAIVNGQEIKRGELEESFQSTLKAAGRTVDELPADQRMAGYRMLLEQMITDRVINDAAKGIEVTDKEVDEQFGRIKQQFPSEEALNQQIAAAGETLDGVKKEIRNSLKQQKWVEKQVGDKVAVSEKDAKDFYEKNPDQFKMPPTVRASHILITVPEDATPEVTAEKQKKVNEVAGRLKKGEDFAKVAKEVSEDPGSKENGGDLDFFSKDRMVPEFADAAFILEPGKVSDPVKTQFGFHLIKVAEKKDGRTVSFDEAKERINGYLKEQKQNEAVDAVLKDARQKADVKNNLPAAPEPKTEG